MATADTAFKGILSVKALCVLHKGGQAKSKCMLVEDGPILETGDKLHQDCKDLALQEMRIDYRRISLGKLCCGVSC